MTRLDVIFTIMSTFTIRPNENDVLLGRGGNNHSHCGNEQLRRIAQERAGEYRASTKKEKAAISRQIVQHIQSLKPSGRFLSKNYSTCEWGVVKDAVAREKVCQAFRDAVAIEREKLRDMKVAEPLPDPLAIYVSREGQKIVEKNWTHHVIPDKPRSADITTCGNVSHYDQSNYLANVNPITLQIKEEMIDDSDRDLQRYHHQSDNFDGVNPIVTPIKQEMLVDKCDEQDYSFTYQCNVSDDFDLFDGELLSSVDVDEVFSNATV